MGKGLILTTTPNAVTCATHNQMPVILLLILTISGLIPQCRTSQRLQNC
jgi:hypothetical protein